MLDRAGAIQILLSAVFFIALWRFLAEGFFKSYFAALEERESRSVGDEARAIECRERARQIEATVEVEVSKMRIEGIRLRDDLAGKARTEAQRMLAESSDRASADLERARHMIQQLKTQALSDADAEATKLASVIVAQVLRGESQTLH